MEIQREAGLLAKGTRGQGRPNLGGVSETPPNEKTLGAQGVDKNLAKQARAAAAMSEQKFEAAIRESINIAVAGMSFFMTRISFWIATSVVLSHL
jgi:hypothetical protein